jgi:hypothetical protein
MSGKSVMENKPLDMELLYSALIAYPDDMDAADFMEEHGYTISSQKVAVYRKRVTHPNSPLHAGFVARRDELAPVLEGQLTHNLLTGTLRASVAVNSAIDRAQKMLDDGRVADPARFARDLQQVVAQGTDKRLAMEGRPTQIVEKRSTDEILRALEAKGVVKQVAVESTAITEGDGG